MNPYQTRDKRTKGILWFGIGLLFLCMVVSLSFGRYPISIKDIIGCFLSFQMNIEPFWDAQTENILLQVRLPRILTSVLVGSALAASGASYQCIFRNPMASPDILGATAGASFGAALAILCNQGLYIITLWAFIGSLASVALIYLTGYKYGKGELTILILAGIMIKSLFSSGTAFLKIMADPTDQLPSITYWMMGSFSGISFAELLPVFVPMVIGLIILLALRWKMNLLTMDEAEAASMGVNVKQIRMMVIFAATLLTASAVSISGVIDWVGLVIPHIVRRTIGNDYKNLLPFSLVFGGLYMLLVDNIARNLMATEIPIGILTSVVGAPFFIWLLLGREGN